MIRFTVDTWAKLILALLAGLGAGLAVIGYVLLHRNRRDGSHGW